MADPPKKFTFGFAKTVKKSNLVAPVAVCKEKPSNVQFIECLESNTIKLKEGEDLNKAEEPLVIPMIGPRKSSTIPNGKSIAEIVEDFSDVGPEIAKQEIKQEVIDDNTPGDSLEAMAAREILQEGADTLKEKPESTLESLPGTDNLDSEKLQKESTLEDYENIPVTQFGLAMLRGMGWKADEGIGKNKKLVPVTAPVVRPKGMGLGADKVILAAALAAKGSSKKEDEELKMMKGAYVKIVAGMHRDHYAQVEGFTDDSGRVVLKLAIGGHVVSVNEATVCLVSKTEYTKNSKVLNATKFDEFKKKEESEGTMSKPEKKSPLPDERPRHKSPSSSRVSKQSNSGSNQFKDCIPKREASLSPTPNIKKEKYYSRSCSRSPKPYEKKSSSKSQRKSSRSPSRRQSRRDSPDLRRSKEQSSSSVQKRSTSSSPERFSKQKSSKSRKSRSRSHSRSRDDQYHHRKQLLDSDYTAYKKKKKKHKERRRAHSSSSSNSVSRSRSRSPRAKKKSKKSRRSHSRSPNSRRRR